MRARFLHRDERIFAGSIFGKTIPLDDVLVTDNAGAAIGPVEPFDSPTGRSKYCLAMGREGYSSCLASHVRPQFVHGLTHIWQRRFSGIKMKSLCDQNLVSYQLGRPWRDYSAEQQAKLVSDWATEGMRVTDPRAAYISNHIRTGAA